MSSVFNRIAVDGWGDYFVLLMKPKPENRWKSPTAASGTGGISNEISQSSSASEASAFGGRNRIQNEFSWWNSDWFKQWERLARKEG
jgi:hypothetical protein